MSLQAVSCSPIFWLPPEVILHSVLPYLNLSDVAAMQKTCRYFYEIIREHAAYILGTPHAFGIVAKYGFEPFTDPRNKMIIQKAFEACFFEGEGDDLTPETLGDKFKIVEDRNLVKIYTHFEYGHAPSTIDGLKDQLWAVSKTDIKTAADTIRERFGKETHLSNRSRHAVNHIIHLHLQPLEHSEALPLSYRYVSVIPPEIQYFGTCGIHAEGNRIMLISRHIHLALRETFRGSAKFDEIVGDLNIANNQLGTLPEEARELWGIRADGSRRPILWQPQNDQNPEVAISFL